MFRLLLFHYAYSIILRLLAKSKYAILKQIVADCFEVGDEDSDMCKPFANAINTFQMEPYL